MNLSRSIYYLIAVLSLLNFVRVTLLIVGSDWHDIKRWRRQKRDRAKDPYQPQISIIIPAYNEETGVIRTVDSVLHNGYANKQIVIVSDGSKDRTVEIAADYLSKLQGVVAAYAINNQRRILTPDAPPDAVPDIILVDKPINGGKATAINLGASKYATGKLFMVLDADSVLRSDAIANMVAHFRDRRVISSAANVKILKTFSLIGMIQRYEYMISYRIKRGLANYKIEYIIGGVGSTFRREVFFEVGMMDTDTMTEDIDFTVKLIKHYGNKKKRIHYAPDVVAYTEHVLSFKGLIKQRYRWKYGRFQTFMKHRKLFFNSSSKRFSKLLTWYQLPYALFGETIQLIEPLLVAYIIYVLIRFSDVTSLRSVYLIVTGYVFIMLFGEDSESFKEKLLLAVYLPFMYVLLYVVSAVEYIALLKSIRNHRQLLGRKYQHGAWEHVERSSVAVAVN